MDSHNDSESSNRAGGSSSSSNKKKGAKKKAQGAKKPAPKSQRSEIPVLRIIDGNAAPSPPPPSNGASNNAEPVTPTAAKKEPKVALQDTGNDENAGSPIRTRIVQPERSNGNLNGDTGNAKRNGTTDEVDDHRKPSSSQPKNNGDTSSGADTNVAVAEVAEAHTKTESSQSEKNGSSSTSNTLNGVPPTDTKAESSDTDKNGGEDVPETYAEAVKEGLEEDGGIDGQKDGQDDVVRPEPNRPPAMSIKHMSNDGLKQRHVKMEKPQDVEENDYPPLPLPGSTHEEGGTYEEVRLDSFDLGGVTFAPWNIPLKRRLQTLAVIMHSLSIAGTASFFFFLCAIPLTWPLLVPYLLHILLSNAATDGKLRFRSERFRRSTVWKHFAGYFPIKLHKTHDLPPTRKYIFGYHPHGIISHGGFAAFATEALGFSEKFPGITNSLLTLDSNFRIPIYREYILSLGIRSVSKESITATLNTGGPNGEGMGRAVTIVIGGARESLEAQPGTMHLVLGGRRGFIKLAIVTGADLVPVLAFGENDLYDQVNPKTHPNLRRAQMFALRTLKFTLPFLHGRGIFNYDVGLLPYRRPVNVVVGKPIKVAQVRDEVAIDPAEVERLHGLYVGEVMKMWERYKDQFATRRKEEIQIMN